MDESREAKGKIVRVERRAGLSHIEREADGTAIGRWGPFTLRTAFQPIFAFHEGKLRVEAFEALVRPFRNGEPETPPAFFATCNASDRLQVEELTRTLHLLNAGVCLPEGVMLFINIDPSVFTEQDIGDTTLRNMRLVLSSVGIAPARVVCEVTENPTGSQEAFYSFVTGLRGNGFRIAVDDYGADESDISRIKDLMPDIVKFDAVWINRLMESDVGFALLATMVRSFEEQGIRTVFEGIEEDWQIELAEKSGASMVQGFVLARPVMASPEMKGAGTPPPEPEPEEQLKPAAPRSGPQHPPGRTFGRRVVR